MVRKVSVFVLLTCMASTALPAARATTTVSERMVRAFDTNKNGHALKLARRVLAAETTTPRERAQARLVQALVLVRTNAHDGATAALAELERDGPSLGRFGAQLAIGVRAAEDRCAEAQALAQTFPKDSIFAFGAWARITNCWLREGTVEQAALASKMIAPSASTDTRVASSLLLEARVLEEKGEGEAARDIYRRILVEHPWAPAIRVTRQRLAALRRKGIRYAAITPAELVRIADNYRAANQVDKARELYLDVQKRTEKVRKYQPEWQRAQLGLIELMIVDGEYTDALALLDRLEWARDLDNRARARLLIGDLQGRQGRIADAIRTWDWLLVRIPDSPYTIDAALAGAKLAYGARYLNRSRAFIEWLLERNAERLTSSRVGDDGVHRNSTETGSPTEHAHWLLAWIERRSGAPSEVVDSHLAQIPTESPLWEGAIYWRARLASDAGDDLGAGVFVEMLRQRSPTSYYALLGHDLLARTAAAELEPPGIPSLVDPDGPLGELDVATAPDLGGLITLHRHGLTKEARAELRALPATELSPVDRIAAAYIYRAVGDQHRAAVVARRAVQRPLDALDPIAFQLAFPRPFGSIVEERANEYGVPTSLLFAIMREESGFNPEAISVRKARGLMQMIRPTARRMAVDAELERFRVRDLFQPPTSVHLGTHYVAGLMQLFNRSLVATIASYQAGERNVAGWLEFRGSMPADEFVEDIPLSSTRRYVKQVLSSYGIYRMLYEPRPRLTIDLPLSAEIGAGGPGGAGPIRWARAEQRPTME